jgi:cytochrome c-type biogenesis protein
MVTDLLLKLEDIFNASPGMGLLVSFLAGILAGFSPCVYPLIPITTGVIGAHSVSSKAKGFTLSLIFVLGVAFTYTLLGVLASVLGIFLARFFINPVTYAVLGIVFLVFGFSLFDVIKLNFFASLPGYRYKGGFFSLFILGAVSALAIAPCNFPVLGSILTMIAVKKDVLYGAIALFIFAFGYSFLLLIVGTFTSVIVRLPKHGQWLVTIKRITGFILFLMGGYFLWRAYILWHQ